MSQWHSVWSVLSVTSAGPLDLGCGDALLPRGRAEPAQDGLFHWVVEKEGCHCPSLIPDREGRVLASKNCHGLHHGRPCSV